MSAGEAPPRGALRTRNLRVRLAVGFVHRLLGAMITPFMAIYLAREIGVAVTGLLMTVVAIVGVVAGLSGGPLADRLGRRPLLIAGELGTALCYLGMAACTSALFRQPVLTYVLFLLAAALSTLILPAHEAMVVDVTDTGNRNAVYLIKYWLSNLAFGVGGLLGGLLFSSWFPLVLTVAGGMLIVVGVVTTVFITETGQVSERHPGTRSWLGLVAAVRGYRVAFGDRRFTGLLIPATLAMAVELQLTSYIGVRLAHEFPRQPLLPGLDMLGSIGGVEMVGLLRAANTLLVVALALPAQFILHRIGERKRLVGGLLLFTGGYVVLAVSNMAWVLLIAVVVLTIGELMNVPVKQSLVAAAVPEHSRGTYLAVYGLNFGVGYVIASLSLSLGALLPSVGMAVYLGILGLTATVMFARASAPRITDQRDQLTGINEGART